MKRGFLMGPGLVALVFGAAVGMSSAQAWGADAGTDAGSTGTLGSTCTSNSDCNSGLTCELPGSNDFGSGGPSLGYCTTTCTQNSDCTSFDSAAQCVNVGSGSSTAYCLEGCDPSGQNQCQGRYDSLCMPLAQTGADGGVIDGGTTVSACMPVCATDNDCGGRKCDMNSGLCVDTPKSGQPVGAPCNPQAIQGGATDPCAGFCISDSTSDPTSGFCTGFCSTNSLGVPGACGSNPQQGTAQDAACLFQATFTSGAQIGICGQLCDCDSDCLGTGEVCQSWANAGISNPSQFTQMFNRAGLCVTATGAEGGTITGITCGDAGGTAGSGTGGAATGGSGGSAGSATGGTGATATRSSSSSSCSCAVVGADENGAALGGGLFLLGLGLMLRRRRRR